MNAAQAERQTEKAVDAYRSIGEVARELGLPTHVLRYWEGRFPRQVKPVKRPDGRRLFRREDIESLRAIQILVHERGMTLKGAKALLLEQGVAAVLAGEAKLIAPPSSNVPPAVHRMQSSLREAFGGETGDTVPAAGGQDGAVAGEPGSPERLRRILSDMTDLKLRLDSARLRMAA